MVTDAILNLVFGFVNAILDGIPLMEISESMTVLNAFLDIVGAALYFFPWQKVVPIVGIIVMLQTWRIAVSIIKAIWAILPFV